MSDFKDLFGDWQPGDEHEQHIPREMPGKQREVKVINVFRETDGTSLSLNGGIFVLLKDNLGRQLRIYTEKTMAIAISLALSNEIPDRPFTHDLLKNMVDRLGGSIDHVVIDDLMQSIFYAKIALIVKEDIIMVDARPTDAIVIALRYRCPIYVHDSVLDAAQSME